MLRSLWLALPLCTCFAACTGTIAVETTQPAAHAIHTNSVVSGEDDGNAPGSAASAVVQQRDDGNIGAAASETVQQKDDGNYGGAAFGAVQEPIRPPRFQ
jgi:hypothetical protein